MRFLILTYILLLIGVICNAQTDFRKGYIISNDRDTIHGLINFKEGAGAYSSCDFRREGNENTETFTPVEIRGYGFVNDKIFESIQVSKSDQSLSMAFFEVLVRGRVTLYKWEADYWISKDNQGLQQLTNDGKETQVDGKRVFKYTNAYISTLNILLFDCAKIRASIQRVSLTQRELTNLVDRYNECNGGASVIFKANKPWTKINIGLIAGLSYSQLDTFDPSFYLSIGTTLDIRSPRLTERISFHGNLLYGAPKFYRYSETGSGSSLTRDYITINLQQLKIPLAFRYTFPERKLTPYVNAGIVSTINLSSTSSWLREEQSGSVIEPVPMEFPTINANDLGYWAGVGGLANIKNKFGAFVELRLESTSLSTLGTSYKILCYQLVVGIRTK